jgi:hypothetical protein
VANKELNEMNMNLIVFLGWKWMPEKI